MGQTHATHSKKPFCQKSISCSNKFFFVARNKYYKSAGKWQLNIEIRFWNKKIQSVRFWIEKKYNASDFEFRKIQRVRFWNKKLSRRKIFKKTFALKILRFFFLLLENDLISIFCSFFKARFQFEFLNWKKNKKIQRVKFWIFKGTSARFWPKNFKTRKILFYNFFISSNFELNIDDVSDFQIKIFALFISYIKTHKR